MRGLKHSEESKTKISEYGKNNHHVSEEGRKNISEALTGRKISNESKQKMSDSAKNKIVSEETRNKLKVVNSGEKNHNYGKPRDNETKNKISESHKGMTYSKETKKKQSESKMGRKTKRKSSSKYVGVHFNKRRNKWIAGIRCDGKTVYIGQFDNEKEAAFAYNQKAIELYGENAKLNIIE